MLEPKVYLLMQLQEFLNYEHIDQILTSMEQRFGDFEEFSSNSYILCNLNPIKSACHLLMLLSSMEQIYSIVSLRTESLYEKVVVQARLVLDRLFFPQQMKFQLRQVDMMNKTSLYYLEHLDAFAIMQSHIMDRVMQEYWQSNIDASGSVMGASTAYGILTHKSTRFDFEL
mmetsp:Transcript_566/g.919  ORF Transcript_566/g.919 Transcript_566/m.919 type:complete len:171 (+) Transcript_566:859-1371(+)